MHIPNENLPLGDLRISRVFSKFHEVFPLKMSKTRRKYGLRETSAFVLFLQVPCKSSVFGSKAEDLRETSALCQKRGKKVPFPAFAEKLRAARSVEVGAGKHIFRLYFWI